MAIRENPAHRQALNEEQIVAAIRAAKATGQRSISVTSGRRRAPASISSATAPRPLTRAERRFLTPEQIRDYYLRKGDSR